MCKTMALIYTHIRKLVLVAAVAAGCLLVFPAAAQTAPAPASASGESRAGDAAKTGTPDSSANLTLANIKLGTFPEYSRLVFTFNRPLSLYKVQRAEVDELRLHFGPVAVQKTGRLNLNNQIVQDVALIKRGDLVVARVKMKTVRFDFRHFTTPDRKAVILDLRSILTTTDDESKKEEGPYLALPQPKPLAESVRARLPRNPKPGTVIELLARAMDDMIAGNFASAAALLEQMKTDYPKNNLSDPALYLLAECYFYTPGKNFSDKFLGISSTFREALTEHPKSGLAPRGKFLRSLAYLKMDYFNEGIAFLKMLLDDHPESHYALLAKIYLAKGYLATGKRSLAKDTFDQVLVKRPRGPMFFDAYYELGEAYFSDGLYSQANEVFKEIVNQADQYYIEHPQILYNLGEGYFHLKRMNLARAYLFHVLNLSPKMEGADMIMARIGDTYKESGKTDEAIKMYTMTRRLHPGTTGSLIAQMRLADFGALRSVFRPESVFIELAEGSLEATIKMYREIVDADPNSPLAQLALFKIGSTYFSQGEFKRAIETFTKILTDYPKGNLNQDARDILNKAILAEIKSLAEQKKHLELVAFYTEHRRQINDNTWPDIRHLLADAYAALDMPREAIALWEANKDLTTHEDERLLGLGDAYYKTGQYDAAVDALSRFRKRMPKHPQAVNSLVTQARAEAAMGQEEQARRHLEEALAKKNQLDDPGAVYGLLGELYLKAGEFERGIEAMQRRLETLKNDEAAKEELFITYSRMGQAYTALGRTEPAEKALQAALDLGLKAPYPETLYLIARTYNSLGMADRYRSTLDLMLKTTDPFWRDVADKEILALTPDDKIGALLEAAPE